MFILNNLTKMKQNIQLTSHSKNYLYRCFVTKHNVAGYGKCYANDIPLYIETKYCLLLSTARQNLQSRLLTGLFNRSLSKNMITLSRSGFFLRSVPTCINIYFRRIFIITLM